MMDKLTPESTEETLEHGTILNSVVNARRDMRNSSKGNYATFGARPRSLGRVKGGFLWPTRGLRGPAAENGNR
jgi:hypothetical protein